VSDRTVKVVLGANATSFVAGTTKAAASVEELAKITQRSTAATARAVQASSKLQIAALDAVAVAAKGSVAEQTAAARLLATAQRANATAVRSATREQVASERTVALETRKRAQAQVLAAKETRAAQTRQAESAAAASKSTRHFAEATGAFIALEVGKHMIQQAGDFQQGTNVLVTAAGESQKNIGLIRQGIQDIAVGTGTPLKDLTDGMYQVEKAGYRGAEGLKILKTAAQGAREEGASLATVTSAITSVMQSYHIPVSQNVSVMNELKTAAGESKTSMEEFAGSLATVLPVASANHISFAQLGGALATLTQHGTSAFEATQELANTIRNLAAPNAVAVKEMGQLGISSQDVSQKLGQRGVAGTLNYLSETILRKMGPSGKVLLGTFLQSTSAGKDVTTMLGAMDPATRKLADQFVKGTITSKGWVKALGGLTPQQASLARQFATSENKARGFNASIRAGGPASQTYTAAIKAMTGGANGLNTTLQLTGESTAGTTERIKKIADAAKIAGKDVDGWSTTQKNFNTQMGQFHEQVNVLSVRIGNALIPKVLDAAKALERLLTFVQDNSAVLTPLAVATGGLAVSIFAVNAAASVCAKSLAAWTIVVDLAQTATLRALYAMDALKLSAAGVGKAFAVVGVAAAAVELEQWIAKSNVATTSSNDMAKSLIAVGDGATKAGALGTVMSTSGLFGPKIQASASAFRAFGDAANGALSNDFINRIGRFGDGGARLAAFTKQTQQLDAGLSSMVSSGHITEATTVMGRLTAAAKAQGVPVGQLTRYFPAYARTMGLVTDPSNAASHATGGLAEDFKVAAHNALTAARSTKTAGSAAKAAGPQYEVMGRKVGKSATAVDLLNTAISAFLGEKLSLPQAIAAETLAFQNVTKSVLRSKGALDRNTGSIHLNTVAGANLENTLADVSTKTYASAQAAFTAAGGQKHMQAATAAANKVVDTARTRLVNQARSAGLSKTAADHLADSVGLARDQFGKWITKTDASKGALDKHKTASDHAKTSADHLKLSAQNSATKLGAMGDQAHTAASKVDSLRRAQERLHNSSLTITYAAAVNSHTKTVAQGLNVPGADRLATGGTVQGSSPSPTADNIPIWATAGEFMHPVQTVNYYGADVMEAMRQRRVPRDALKGYATGGLIDPRLTTPGLSRLISNMPVLGAIGPALAKRIDDTLGKAMAHQLSTSITKAVANLNLAGRGGGGGTGGGGGRGGSGPVSTGANVALGRLMAAAYGWTGGQFVDLNKLWTQESGWNNHARNPSSGAYGIPQGLPPGKMGAAAAGGNAHAQIAWGLRYIKDRYGSPAGAWAHEIRNNWYARGGTIPGVAPYPTADNVLAHVTPGEFVVRNGPSQVYRPLLEAINAQSFANGGVITSLSTKVDRLQSFASGGPVAPDLSAISSLLSSATYSTKDQVTSAAKAQLAAIAALKSSEASLARARSAHHVDTRQVAADEAYVALRRAQLQSATVKLWRTEASYKASTGSTADKFASAVTSTVATDGAFIANLQKLAGLGFGFLANQLLAQGDDTAHTIAAQAVRWSRTKLTSVSAGLAKSSAQQGTLALLPAELAISSALKTGRQPTLASISAATGIATDELQAGLIDMQKSLRSNRNATALLGGLSRTSVYAQGTWGPTTAKAGAAQVGPTYQIIVQHKGPDPIRAGELAMAGVQRHAAVSFGRW